VKAGVFVVRRVEVRERKRGLLAFGGEKTHVFCYDEWEVMKWDGRQVGEGVLMQNSFGSAAITVKGAG
jgi:hypothetical protein